MNDEKVHDQKVFEDQYLQIILSIHWPWEHPCMWFIADEILNECLFEACTLLQDYHGIVVPAHYLVTLTSLQTKLAAWHQRLFSLASSFSFSSNLIILATLSTLVTYLQCHNNYYYHQNSYSIVDSY